MLDVGCDQQSLPDRGHGHTKQHEHPKHHKRGR
jgi:hypothetical protein